jgi:hypothetical protein
MGTDPDEDYAAVSWIVPVATGMLAIQINFYYIIGFFCQFSNQIYPFILSTYF